MIIFIRKLINQEEQPFPRYIVFDEVRKNNPIIKILILKIANHSKSLFFFKENGFNRPSLLLLSGKSIIEHPKSCYSC